MLATGGYFRQNAVFSYLTVPKSGHFVPNWINFYPPTLQFLSDMMFNNGMLSCPPDAPEVNCSVATDQIKAMNNCSYPQGMGNMTTGQCDCDPSMWKGGDCGMKAHALDKLNSLELSSVGPEWFSVYWNDPNDRNVTVTITNTSVPLDVYVSKGWNSDPNKFEYDAKFSAMASTLKLNSAYLHTLLGGSTGFAISIYVDGIDTKQN